MADPLSIVGALVAIAQITPTVVNHVRAFKHASAESRQLLLEVSSTSGIVLSLKDLADETSSADSWWSTLASLSDFLKAYEEQLRSIARILEPITRRHRDAFKWPFDKTAIRDMLTNMERFKTTFLLALQSIQVEVSESIQGSIEALQVDVRQIREGFDYLRGRDDAKDAETVLQWLSPLDFQLRQNDNFYRRHGDTGSWLLREPLFESWISGDLSILCCEGIPGAGKTILAAIVVDHLRREVERSMDSQTNQPETSVICLYCMYKERDSQTAEHLLGSVVKQLAESYPRQFLPEIREFYQACKKSRKRPIPADFVSLLGSMLRTFRRNYIVIDALDECTDDVKDSLLDSHKALQEICNLKIMVTLRPDTITASLNPFKTGFLQVRAQNADIEKYLRSRIASETRSFTTVKSKPDLVTLTINTILSQSQGMFLLARLHLDSVAKSMNPAALKTNLQKMPRQLDATYDEAMLRIEDQDGEHAILAKKVLLWLLYAWRSLTPVELQHALAVESTVPGHGLDEEHMIHPDDIIYSCAGLVTLDRETNIVRMVHYSAQEYLSAKRQIHIPDGHDVIVAVCLKYLTSDPFADGRCTDEAQLKTLKEKHPFLDYAAQYWGHHARNSGPNANLWSSSIAFMKTISNSSIAAQTAHQQYIHLPWRDYPLDSPIIPPLMVAAHFGLSDVAAILLDQGADIDERPLHGFGALGIASRDGFEKVVRLLLDRGADLHKSQRHGITALHQASSKNHPQVVEMLVQHDRSIIKSRNMYGKSALHDAAERGFADTVRVLLQFGPHLTEADNTAKTPLSYAAGSGDIPTVKMILEAGVPVDSSKKPPVEQAINAAAHFSQHSMLRFLLREGAAIDSRSFGHNNTVLHDTVCGGADPAIIRLVMEQKNSQNALNGRNVLGKAPLHDAVERNRLAAVATLLEFDPEMEPDNEGRTPLHWAVYRNHIAVTKLLLEKKRDREFINKRAGPKFKNMTVLEMAVDKQHIEIIKMLSEAL
ncbi:MAG: hypothetical protein Q9181_007702 [Wetmoreana brouardii]